MSVDLDAIEALLAAATPRDGVTYNGPAQRLRRDAPGLLTALVAEVERLRTVADAVRKYLGADAAMQSDPSALSVRITAFDRWQSARTAAYAALAALDALDAGGEGADRIS